MSERTYEAYGSIDGIPSKKSKLDNSTKAGSLTVNGILLEHYDGNIFPKMICGDVLVDVNAGYIGNDLIKFAPILCYPFELRFKKNKEGKNVIS